MDVFILVSSQIIVVGALNVDDRSENDKNVKIKMGMYIDIHKQHEVVYKKFKSKFLCDCKLYDFIGIPCIHIICSIRVEQDEIIFSDLEPNNPSAAEYANAVDTKVVDVDFDDEVSHTIGGSNSNDNDGVSLDETNSEDDTEEVGISLDQLVDYQRMTPNDDELNVKLTFKE
ncbi:hypothetical protein VNO78_02680 [Psophocarpus tetragonolobus]|uniref:SWIM-type domain-containing protein n=1 Tax=Psophocarpus tetragonolobus TaxID=3891 RepID=A0AAN9T2X1_PSOTE